MARTANPDAMRITWDAKDGTGTVPEGFKTQSKPTTNPADKDGEKVSVFYAATSDPVAADKMFASFDSKNRCRVVNNYLEGLTRAKYFGGAQKEIDAIVAEALKGKTPDQVRAALAALLG